MWFYYWIFYSVPLIYVYFYINHIVLTTVALQCIFKSKSMKHSALFVFFQGYLCCLGLLCFCAHNRIVSLLIGISLNLWIALGNMVILTIIILSVHEHRILIYFFCLSQFLLSIFYSLHCKELSFLY